jgi:myo-inositol-1-phosphate synthase
MGNAAKIGVAGIGNNISALIQGSHYYADLRAQGRPDRDFPGVTRAHIGGMAVDDVEIVAAFDVQPQKVGADVADAIFREPNNYPRLRVPERTGVLVQQGLRADGDEPGNRQRIADVLRESGAEVLLYSLPTGLPLAAGAYADAAIRAGVGFVNCTPEQIGRDETILGRFVEAGVPLLGDDLASHLGTSVVHRTLLALFAERGLTLTASYQLNVGGNEDFRNLRERGGSKHESKLNALSQEGVDLDRIEVVPSAGYLGQLQDRKVAYLRLEGAGWANTAVHLDVKLEVQDSSNAAGVIIDLVRIAAAARRHEYKGFIPAAAALLKSPPGGRSAYSAQEIAVSIESLLPSA